MLYTQKNLNLNEEKGISARTKSCVEGFKKDLLSSPEYEALNIAFKDDDLDEIINFSVFLNKNFKKVVVFGIGGSSLGAKTLLSVKNQNKVLIIENIDNYSLENFFHDLDLKNTAFLTISKSGKTIECISQTLLTMKKIEDTLGKEEIGKHFFFITEEKDSPLTQLAKEFNIKIIPHHKTIGGRFSYLSNVGLIPACVAGLDIKEIRNGAKDALDYFLKDENNFILDIISKQNQLYQNGIVGNIMMTYCERLNFLNDWYRQLWAESLGKDGFGILPIPALGTVDQHSQLQLYISGPKNLFFTFFLKEKDKNSLKITKTYNKGFDHLQNITLDDIMEVEANSTVEILNKKKLPIRIIKIKEINERTISQLMMQFVIETILIAKLNNINPFGQPDVEERKNIAKEMMNNLKSL